MCCVMTTTLRPASSIERRRSRRRAALVHALTDFIPFALEVTRTPGLNIAIGEGGELIWAAGFGHANVADERPMTNETVTRGASVSKLYTAVAILQLVEQGVIG